MKYDEFNGASQEGKHAFSSEPVSVRVRFEFNHPTAQHVGIAGTFNEWDPETKPMQSSGRGCWFKETALAPGNYEYCVVVDGKWMPDPMIEESVPNPFGGRNSVLRVRE